MRHTLWAGLLFLSSVVPLAAAPPVEPVTDPAAIGDGAALCAEAKLEMATLPEREASSLASTNIDIHFYHLNLTINMAGGTLSGTVRIEGTVIGSSLSVLTLDLASPMNVSTVKLPNGTALGFAHPGAALNITLPAPVSVGGAVAVDVTYSGAPIGTGFGSFTFGTRSGDRFAWSLSEPYGARDWWPCKDHPSDKADSVRVSVTVPSAYRVGSQGILEDEVVVGGNTTYHWVTRYPISNYLISISAGEYVRHLGTYTRSPALAGLYGALSMPLDHLVYDDGTTTLPSGWGNVADVLDVFEDWFGPYAFADEKYGHSEVTFGGGMEHQTMSSMGGSAMGLVAHELAHQWYGDAISPQQWPHLWLNEGFATYAEIIYFQVRASTYPGQASGLITTRYNTAHNATGTLVLQDTSSVGYMFDGNRVYAKGSVVLHMLRYVVGDTDFKAIMKAYSADPAVHLGVATTDDFHRVAETVSGMDLDAFFSQWVTTGTGYPFYRSYNFWQPYLGTYKVWVTLEQFQTQPWSNVNVFEMPVEILVQTTLGPQTFTVQNNQRKQTFELTTTGQPTSVTIDPNEVILRSDVLTGVVDRVPSLLAITSLMPNPAQTSVTLHFVTGTEGRVDVDVYDVAGRHMFSQPRERAGAGAGSMVVDTSSLASGVYFVRLTNGTERATQKFVVVR